MSPGIKKLAGGHVIFSPRKAESGNEMAAPNFVNYFWNDTIEAVLKPLLFAVFVSIAQPGRDYPPPLSNKLAAEIARVTTPFLH